jgi:hypothetical protein
MTTQAQVEANRRNAQLSTGPKTGAGKQRASRNAVRHGISPASFRQRPRASRSSSRASTPASSPWTKPSASW